MDEEFDCAATIRDLLGDGGSMELLVIAQEVAKREDIPEEQAKTAVVEAVHDGLLVEHSEFSDVYVLADQPSYNPSARC